MFKFLYNGRVSFNFIRVVSRHFDIHCSFIALFIIVSLLSNTFNLYSRNSKNTKTKENRRYFHNLYKMLKSLTFLFSPTLWYGIFIHFIFFLNLIKNVRQFFTIWSIATRFAEILRIKNIQLPYNICVTFIWLIFDLTRYY